MTDHPEVSVVIPTRDRWEMLSLALRVAFAQEGVELEVIVVDDGSRDETPRRLGEIEDPRLRVIRNEGSRGVAGARNRGIADARGEWVAFLDDDDIWSPHKLGRQLEAARAAGAGFVYATAIDIDEGGEPVALEPAPDPEGLLEELLRVNSMPAGSSNVMARTELLRALDGFDERLSQLADWDMWIRLASKASAAACREVLVGYVQHPENMLLVERQDVREEFDYVVTKHHASGRYGRRRPDGVMFTHWAAVGHRRRGRRFRAAAVYLRGAARHRSLELLAWAGRVLLGERVPGAVMRGIRSARGGRDTGAIQRPEWVALFR